MASYFFPFAFFFCIISFTESSDEIFMTDDLTNNVFLCTKTTRWIKGCRLFDFSASGCRPWRLSPCPEPFIQRRLTPCVQFNCKVFQTNKFLRVFFKERFFYLMENSLFRTITPSRTHLCSCLLLRQLLQHRHLHRHQQLHRHQHQKCN